MDDPAEPQFLHMYTSALWWCLNNDLCHSMASSRCLLQPVATEPVDEHEVAQNRVRANYAILVKRVVVVVTRPCTL